MPWWKSIGGHSKVAQSPDLESSSSQQHKDLDVAWSRSDVLRQRQLTRQKKLRHLTALDVEGLKLEEGETPSAAMLSAMRSASVRSSSATLSSAAASMTMPQPLPRPEESTTPGSSCAACRCCHSHSPRAGRGRGDVKEARVAYEPAYPPVEHVGERFSAATPVGR